ncbi:hypothetical protein OG933_41980 [Streptomyces sp. NBC_00016]|uniref:hypothetical protein n=1 Tax=Streptomyces sp. NBC_00016 TaxID=2975622 RepID=UPI003252167C
MPTDYVLRPDQSPTLIREPVRLRPIPEFLLQHGELASVTVREFAGPTVLT